MHSTGKDKTRMPARFHIGIHTMEHISRRPIRPLREKGKHNA